MSLDAAREWLFCSDCEAPCLDRELPTGAELRCGRCGIRVKRGSSARSLQRVWALALAGLILVPLANLKPVLTFDVAGNMTSNLIVTGVVGLWVQGYWPVALLVAFSAMVAPALHLGAVAYLLTGVCVGWRLPGLEFALRLAERMESWNLVAVFAIGTVVAVVKLDMLGKVMWEQGALWVVALSLCSLLVAQLFDAQLVESKLKEME